MHKFSRGILVILWLSLAMVCTAPMGIADQLPSANAHVEYSHNPDTLLVSFSEIWPEFADQDRTPVVRIYGNGRVLVHRPDYMKRAGQFELMLSGSELDGIVLQLTEALRNFDAGDIKNQKRTANELYLSSLTRDEPLTIFVDSDAEISAFHLNVVSYQPDGAQGPAIAVPVLEKSWRGLKHDARDYPGLQPIQALLQAENAIRALTKRNDLSRVEVLQ